MVGLDTDGKTTILYQLKRGRQWSQPFSAEYVSSSEGTSASPPELCVTPCRTSPMAMSLERCLMSSSYTWRTPHLAPCNLHVFVQAPHLVFLGKTCDMNHTRPSQPPCRITSVTMFALGTERFTAHIKIIVASVSTRMLECSIVRRYSATSTRNQMRQSVITGLFQATQRCRMKSVIVVNYFHHWKWHHPCHLVDQRQIHCAPSE